MRLRVYPYQSHPVNVLVSSNIGKICYYQIRNLRFKPHLQKKFIGVLTLLYIKNNYYGVDTIEYNES